MLNRNVRVLPLALPVRSYSVNRMNALSVLITFIVSILVKVSVSVLPVLQVQSTFTKSVMPSVIVLVISMIPVIHGYIVAVQVVNSANLFLSLLISLPFVTGFFIAQHYYTMKNTAPVARVTWFLVIQEQSPIM